MKRFLKEWFEYWEPIDTALVCVLFAIGFVIGWALA